MTRKGKLTSGAMVILLIASFLYNVFGVKPPDRALELLPRAYETSVATIEFCDEQLANPELNEKMKAKLTKIKDDATEAKEYVERLAELWDVPLTPEVPELDAEPSEPESEACAEPDGGGSTVGSGEATTDVPASAEDGTAADADKE